MSHTKQTVGDRFFNEWSDMPTEQEQEFFKTTKEMYSSDKNINFKTDIANPPLHSVLDLMGDYFNDIGMKDGAKYTRRYSRYLKEQMVSDNRKGRTEFKEIMIARIQQLARSVGERLTGKHQENE